MASTTILRRKSETEATTEPTTAPPTVVNAAAHGRRRPTRHTRHRTRHRRIHASTVMDLNNVAAYLLEGARRDSRDCDYEEAIDILREAAEILVPPSVTEEDNDAQGRIRRASLLARAEARLAWAMERRKQTDGERLGGKIAAEKCSAARGDDSGGGSPFACAGPVRMRTSRGTDRSDCGIPSLQGLLSVISYNFGLAHQLLGARLGCEMLVNRAKQLYRKSEVIILSITDSEEDIRVHFPLGVIDVTYMARAIVNNMGLILFDWGEPDAGREFFDGLNGISVEGGEHGDNGKSEANEERQKEKGSSDGWHNFSVNALIAKGMISSPAA